jgi:hypothetical protein
VKNCCDDDNIIESGERREIQRIKLGVDESVSSSFHVHGISQHYESSSSWNFPHSPFLFEIVPFDKIKRGNE